MKHSNENITEINQYSPSEVVGECSDIDELKLENEHEVFKKSKDIVDFRTVGWLRASSICIKSELKVSQTTSI